MQVRLTAYFALAVVTAGLSPCADSSPDPAALRMQYVKQHAIHETRRRERFHSLLEQHLARARREYDNARRSGNITRTAVARRAVRILETCLAELKDRGTFDIPERVRRELVDTMDRLRREKASINAAYEQATDELEETLFRRFVSATGNDADTAEMKTLRRKFTALIEGTMEPAPETPTTPDAAPARSNATASPPPSDIIAFSTSAEAWLPFARLYATVSGLQVITVPIAGRDHAETNSHVSPITQSTVKTRYEPLHAIRPSTNSAFRVKRIDGTRPVDVIAWPAPGNDWSMQFRIRAPAGGAFEHAVELQVDRTTVTQSQASVTTGTAGSPSQASPPPASGTPVEKTFSLTADADWTSSGLRVRKGDLVEITAAGAWVCASGGEFTTADGYPRSADFQPYYNGPQAVRRLLPRAPYGALLIRIGDQGPVGFAGGQTRMISPADGILYFTANEALTPAARKDNRGRLSISIRRETAAP